MIASLTGQVQEIDKDNIVIEVGGVGLKIFVPTPDRDQLHPGESVFLHTHLVVREDALTLFGFKTKDERNWFVFLLGVSGIGPRLALAVLSVLTPDALRRAVFHEQAEVFIRVPGIGKRTAQKILLHLHDRVPMVAGLEPIPVMSDVDTEVIAGLTALGYSVVEAQSAIQKIPRETPQDLETRLRLALQYFAAP